MKTWLACVLGLIAVGTGIALDDKEHRYNLLYKVFQVADAVKGNDARGVVFVIPMDRTVELGKARITIAARSGAVPLDVEADGEIRDFPRSDELLKENPEVMTNQPKGSLDLSLQLALNFPDRTTFSYQELQSLVDAAMAQTRKQTSPVTPEPTGVVFVFADRNGAMLTSNLKSGRRRVGSDRQSWVKCALDRTLLGENPVLTLSGKPTKVLVEF